LQKGISIPGIPVGFSAGILEKWKLLVLDNILPFKE
jgi:hypothetical protein